MKLKLDENLGNRGATLFRAAGHDVATVVEQNLTSTPDSDLLTICHSEGRALVTLDMDFSNPLVFEPDNTLALPCCASQRESSRTICGPRVES